MAFAPAALPFLSSVFDAAVVGEAGPFLDAARLLSLLRPGGRLIALAAPADRATLLDRLGRSGFVHLFAKRLIGARWCVGNARRKPPRRWTASPP